MANYFSEVSGKRGTPEEEEARYPRAMDKINFEDPFTDLSDDHLTVKYTYGGSSSSMEGMVQPRVQAPINCIAYYFEILVTNAGSEGRIATGFSTASWIDSRGSSEFNKCYYHGDTGLIHCLQGKGLTVTAANKTTTSTYTTGDIVGCGIDYVSQEFFFTKNGSLVGTSPKVFKRVLYPTVALHSNNEEVTVNFEPQTFLFDLVGYKTFIKGKLSVEIEKISISPSVILDLVKSYLAQYGYQNTLHALGGPDNTDSSDSENHSSDSDPDPDNHPPHPPSGLEVVLRQLRASSYFCRH
ncbi:ran-binding protein M homolog [Brassica napus]|uniref:(rape) hypothetical protein n=1 Tax=Brassica napus TaxID=3708 RepID=A0A816VVH1_BRANA|nr:ran-binding protein M homolog [Brassica napus]CAF2125006.1 unnamed protein product [Brassica napus]